jgi:hypothetical protein
MAERRASPSLGTTGEGASRPGEGASRPGEGASRPGEGASAPLQRSPRSLGALVTSKREAPDEWDDVTRPWPAPIGTGARRADRSERHERSRAPGPVSTGPWGHPARTGVEGRGDRVEPRACPPAGTPPLVWAAPAPPPPPLPRSGRRPSRLRSALIEAGAAIAILALAATLLAGSGSTSGADAKALAAWGQTGTPALTRLVDDIGPLQRQLAGGDRSAAALQASTAALQRELAAARALPAPPDPVVAGAWESALGSLQEVLSRLAGPRLPPLGPLGHLLGSAAQELLEVSQAVAG